MALKNLNWDSVCEAIATLYGTDAQTIANTLNNRGIATGDVEGAFKCLKIHLTRSFIIKMVQ